MLEEDVGGGAVQLVFVVAVVVAGDQVEPIVVAGGPEGDLGADIGRDVSSEQGRCRYGRHQPPVLGMVAETQVEVTLVFVQHLEREVVVDGADAEASGQLGGEVAAERVRIGRKDAADAA